MTQPDTLIPNPVNPQAFNRYSYVLNSPINFNDPTGHVCSDPEDLWSSSCDGSANVKTKIEDKMVSGNGKTPGLGSCGGFGQKKCRTNEEANVPCITCNINPQTRPESASVPSILSEGGYEDPELELLLDFWDTVVSPFTGGLDMHEAYVLASSNWYKTPVWSLPTGGFEAAVAGYRQYYRDSWWESYTPYQRSARVVIVAVEAYAIDKAASAVGTLGGGAGGLALSPGGAFVSYGVTAYATSQAGYNLAVSINKWVFPTFGLGLY